MCSGRHPAHGIADKIFLPVLTDREGTLEAGKAAVMAAFSMSGSAAFCCVQLEGNLGPVPGVQLPHDGPDVHLHGALTQVQLIGDDLVRLAQGDGIRDGALPFREAEQAVNGLLTLRPLKA